MNLKSAIEQAVIRGIRGDMDPVETLVSQYPASVRHFLGMTYHPDPERRRVAARALAVGGLHHPRLIQEVARRLVWAMNDESATNAVTAPEVLEAIARVEPRLLLPVVPDLTRLAADPDLREGLRATLALIIKACPGEVGRSIGTVLRKRLEKGGEPCGRR